MFIDDPTIKGDQLLLAGKAIYEGEQILVELYNNCVAERKPKQRILPFCFQLKYLFSKNPWQIIFEKHGEFITFMIPSEMELMQWRDILKRRLNQRGFHQQFRSKKKIGKGSFASVYLTEKTENGAFYAVKAFCKQSAYCQENGKQCVVKQIQVMRKISSRYCMKLFEVFQTENSLYIVVELLEGGQLFDKIKTKYKFKANEIKTIMISILTGLRDMHSKGIMHRDLKPENLIFRNNFTWDCIIADFGLAEFAQTEKYLFTRCGTPGYVAPEVINIKDLNAKYDPICDIYSLGLIFHILLLGVSAFPGKTYNEVLHQNRQSKISFEGDQYKRIDPVALSLMAKMLTKQPNQRISAAQALLHPYFQNVQLTVQPKQQEIKSKVELKQKQIGTSQSFASPILVTSNIARKQINDLQKDSCVNLKVGKTNIFTGKVDTIFETGSGRGSFWTEIKESKFCRN